MAIRIVNPLEIADWDRQIAAFPSATIFHTAAWARVLVDTYNFKPCYFVRTEASPLLTAEKPPTAEDSASGPIENQKSKIENLAAILPLMSINSWLTGRRGVGLPFTDDCEPLAGDKPAVTDLFDAAADYGREQGWKSLELRGGHNCFPIAPASTSFYGHQIDLQPGEWDLFLRFDPSARRAIRKAEASKVTIETGTDLATVERYYALHCRTRRRHGQPPQSWAFFANIQRHILQPGLGRVLLALHAGRPIAGGVFFHFGPKALYKFGASDASHQHLRGNDLLFWHAIRDFSREGFRTFDLGRTSLPNQGLRHFKLKWASDELPLSYIKYHPTKRCWLNAPDKAAGAHTHLFRAFPLPLSRLVGRLMYPHVG